MGAPDALLEGVEGGGSDVAEDDADGAAVEPVRPGLRKVYRRPPMKLGYVIVYTRDTACRVELCSPMG